MRCRARALSLAVVAALACVERGSGDASDTTGLVVTRPSDTGLAAQPQVRGATAAAAAPGVTGSAPSGGARPERPRGPGARPSLRPSDVTTPTATPPRDSAAPAQMDTVRGIAAVVGAVPVTSVVVRPEIGPPVTLTGALATEVGRASGADVWVRGRRVGDRTIEVTRYAVRSVDGVPAVTGTLVAEGERFLLATDDGRRHRIMQPPASLREHVGARIWISGNLGSSITAYGVLRPRP